MTATKTIRFIDHRQLADGRTVRAGEEIDFPAGEADDHVRNGVAEHVVTAAPATKKSPPADDFA